MKRLSMSLSVISIVSSLTMLSCRSDQADDSKLRDFIANHLAVIEPKLKALNLADWNANATGEKRYYDEYAALDLEIRKIQSNKNDFAFLRGLRDAKTIQDSLLQRQLILLYNNYLKNQIDTALMRAIVEKQSAIANRFNTFRGKIGRRELDDNEILTILKSERNSERRKQAWEASKQVGKEVASMIIELVNLRNQASKQLGYDNYYVMALATDEQDEKEITAVFDHLKLLTDEPFREIKNELDAGLAKKYGITTQALRPWHYEDPFFQRPPTSGGIDLDSFFKGKIIEELGRTFYTGIDLPVDDILKNSDLFPRKGKYQHAYCIDIDRLGDVRVMLNITDNLSWMGTTLHELGHAVYSKYVKRDLPFLLRVESHAFLSEAIAMLTARQASNADWLETILQINDQDKEAVRRSSREKLRLGKLVSCRWAQVMVRFEQGMYQNPSQDLNKLWWDLVEKYQLVRRPEDRNEPDWAAKIHLAQYPCYYHNYMLGELAASQILNSIAQQVTKQEAFTELSFAKKPSVGDYLKKQIFAPGASLHWNDLLKRATGEGLNPKYFAKEFVEQ